MGLWHRVEAQGFDLPLRPLPRLDLKQEPECAGSEAGKDLAPARPAFQPQGLETRKRASGGVLVCSPEHPEGVNLARNNRELL
jgi:hypothetical protein